MDSIFDSTLNEDMKEAELEMIELQENGFNAETLESIENIDFTSCDTEGDFSE